LKFALAHAEDQSMERSRFTEDQIIGIWRSTRPAFRLPIYAVSLVWAPRALSTPRRDGLARLDPSGPDRGWSRKAAIGPASRWCAS